MWVATSLPAVAQRRRAKRVSACRGLGARAGARASGSKALNRWAAWLFGCGLCHRRVAEQGLHCRHRAGTACHGHRRLQLRDRRALSAGLAGGGCIVAGRASLRIRAGRGVVSGRHRGVRRTSARSADSIDDRFKAGTLVDGPRLSPAREDRRHLLSLWLSYIGP